MRRALSLAEEAAAADEVPVGAVVHDDNGDIIGEGYNETLTTNDMTAHAEIVALRRAAAACANHRLPNLHITVSLEPCPMCIGAIFHARLSSVTFAADDDKNGACGGVTDLPALPQLNHRTAIHRGLYATEAVALLREFFRARR